MQAAVLFIFYSNRMITNWYGQISLVNIPNEQPNRLTEELHIMLRWWSSDCEHPIMWSHTIINVILMHNVCT